MASKKILNEILKDPKIYAENMTVSELEKLLRYFSDKYYNTGQSVVSDAVFDIMKDVLEKKDPTNPFVHEVGAPVSKQKVELPYPMGSLDKIKPDTNALEKWLKKFKGPYVISDKLDGASAQLYKDSSGKMKMYSRGDGTFGQDISHLIQYVLPKNVKLDDLENKTGIRGELVMSKKDFETIADRMANARNAVSGLVNSKKIDTYIAKITKFIPYTILYPKYDQIDQMKLLKKYGFDVVPYAVEQNIDAQMLTNYLADRKKKSLYEIDGIVVVDSSNIYDNISGNPEYAFAFKTISDEQIAETVVEDVIWDPSMDAYLIPTIKIKPVKLVGTTITYATAHNAKFVVDNKLGPGAVVKIIRSGDVIPYILEVVKPAKEPKMPDAPYIWSPTKVDIILKTIFGHYADIVNMKLMEHFFSTLGVKFLGRGILTKFVEAGYNTVAKLLKANKEDLINIEGIGEKMVDKIFASIDDALMNATLYNFMDASHIFGRGIGSRKLKLILDEYPNIMNEDWTKKELIEKVNAIKGFSDITTNKFVENFKEFKKFFNEINKIKDISHLIKPPSKKKKAGTLFENEIVVFTGFRKPEWEELVANNGGKVSSSVSSKTTLVVYSAKKGETSKQTKAKELNIKTMSEEEFQEKYIK